MVAPETALLLSQPSLLQRTNGCVTRAEMKIACGVGVWKTYGRPCARSTLLRLSLVARRATRSAGSSFDGGMKSLFSVNFYET